MTPSKSFTETSYFEGPSNYLEYDSIQVLYRDLVLWRSIYKNIDDSWRLLSSPKQPPTHLLLQMWVKYNTGTMSIWNDGKNEFQFQHCENFTHDSIQWNPSKSRLTSRRQRNLNMFSEKKRRAYVKFCLGKLNSAEKMQMGFLKAN